MLNVLYFDRGDIYPQAKLSCSDRKRLEVDKVAPTDDKGATVEDKSE